AVPDQNALAEQRRLGFRQTAMATVNVFLPFRALTWTATGTPSPSVSTATARTALKAGFWKGDRASAFKAPVSAYTTRTNNVFFPLSLRDTREATTARAGVAGVVGVVGVVGLWLLTVVTTIIRVVFLLSGFRVD